jgi:hypothetical protein
MHTAHDDDALETLPVESPPSDEWTAGRVAAAPAPRPQRQSSATFTRLTTLPPALLDELPAWWHTRARDARVHATRRLDLDAPQRDRSGTWRMHGCLRSPWFRRAIGVELQLWPRLGAWTKVSMQPQRRVRVGRRYFRVGHRALDALTERLGSELRDERPHAAVAASRAAVSSSNEVRNPSSAS